MCQFFIDGKTQAVSESLCSAKLTSRWSYLYMYWEWNQYSHLPCSKTSKKKNISPNLKLNFNQVSRSHIVCLIKIHTDCVVIGHVDPDNTTKNSQGTFPILFSALTEFGDILYPVQINFSCIRPCENMTWWEEIVAGQIVYLSEHMFQAPNWKTGL